MWLRNMSRLPSSGRTASLTVKIKLHRTMRCRSRDVVTIYQEQHRVDETIKSKPHPSTSMFLPSYLIFILSKTTATSPMTCFSRQLLLSLIHARHILRTVTVSRPLTSRNRQKQYPPRLRNSVINATCQTELRRFYKKKTN